MHLILWLSVWCFALVVTPGSAKWCTRREAYTARVTERYTVACGGGWWRRTRRCARYRYKYGTRYRQVLVCCSGYRGTHCDLPPESPLRISVTRHGSNPYSSLTGTLTKNGLNDHLVSYRVAVEENGVTKSTITTSGSYTFSGLTPGSRCRVRGWAVGRDGQSPSGNVYSGYIYTTPRSPTSVVLNRRGNPTSSLVAVSGRSPQNYRTVVYKIRLEGNGRTRSTQTAPSSGTYTFTGLTAGQRYRVHSWVVAADGSTSSPTIVSPYVYTAPHTPASVSASRGGNPTSSLTARIQPSPLNYGTVVYKMRLQENGRTTVTTNVPSSRAYSFTGLTPGQKYKVYSWAAVADGSVSSATIATGTVYTTPGTPRNLIEIARTTTSVTIQWSPPSAGVFDQFRLSATQTVYLAKGVTRHVFSGLQPGKGYTVTLTAVVNNRNVQSAAVTTTAVTRPTNPRNLRENTPKRETSFTVSWEPPQNTHQVNGYDWVVSATEYRRSGATSTSTRSLTLPRLVPGRTYRCSVRTRTQVGGKITKSDEAIVTVNLKPGTVRDIMTAGRTTSSVILKWTAPSGDSDSFRVRWRQKGSAMDTGQTVVRTTTHTVPGLRDGAMYTMSVTAISHGVEGTSKSIEVTALPSTLPAPTVQSVSTSTLVIIWTVPATLFDRYLLWITPNDARLALPIGISKTASRSYTFSSLSPGRAYTVSIAAASGSSQGTQSQRIANTKPEVVRSLLKSDKTMSSLTINWTAPVGDSDSFRVRWRIKGSPSDIGQRVLKTTAYRVTGLSSGVTYTLSVSAISHSVEGNSASIDDTTLPSITSAPTVHSVTTTTVTITWTAPSTTFDLYRLWINPNDGKLNLPLTISKTSPRAYTFSSLNPGKAYTISLAVLSESTQSSLVRRTTTAHPLSVSNIRASASGPHTIDVQWSPDPASVQDKYHVTHQGEFVDKSKSSVAEVTGRRLVIDGLHPGEQYQIMVQAVSHGQASKASTISTVTYPYNPATVTVPGKYVQAHDVRLDWTFDEKSSHNTGWKITFAGQDNIIKTAFGHLSLSERSAEVTDLLHVHNYTFTVHGVTVDGVINSTGYSVTATTTFDVCFSNPCANAGTCTYFEDTYKCICREEYVGETCKVKLVKPPSLLSLNPHFGPEAGGTVITIVGVDLITPVDSVVIGGPEGHQCYIRHDNKTHIQAVTPLVSKTDTDVPLKVLVVFPGGLSVVSDTTFEFRGNPEVEKIHPLSTIVNGGTTLTVEGNSMNAVQRPMLEVTMSFKQTNVSNNSSYNTETQQTFENPCIIKNSASILCSTPSITIPAGFRQSNRASDDISGDTHKGVMVKKADTVVNFRRDDSYLTFFLGLRFDGLDTYRNLSSHSTLKQYSILEVHHAPQIWSSDKTIFFEKNKPLTINGTNMDAGLTVQDYKIFVGTGACRMMTLETHKLICMPPQAEPQHLNSTTRNHPIRVNIGANIRLAYGEMFYARTPIYVWILVGLSVTVVVAAAIIVPIVLMRRRRGQNCKDTVKEKTEVDNPGMTSTENVYQIQLGPVHQDMKELDTEPEVQDGKSPYEDITFADVNDELSYAALSSEQARPADEDDDEPLHENRGAVKEPVTAADGNDEPLYENVQY